jgi:hypothetical protein
MMPKGRKTLRCSTAILLAILMSACSIEPWVKPYERANLADPIMSFSRNPIADSYMQHIYDVREGKRGAVNAGGGGCGCN